MLKVPESIKCNKYVVSLDKMIKSSWYLEHCHKQCLGCQTLPEIVGDRCLALERATVGRGRLSEQVRKALHSLITSIDIDDKETSFKTKERT